MKKNIYLLFLLLSALTHIEARAQKSFEIARTHVIPIKDTVSDRRYELYIKLPENYAENKDTRYPAIYFTDAVWHMEILSAATAFIMEDVILVGISWQKDINADLQKEVGPYVSRFRDYTVIQSSNSERQKKYQFGQAGKHLDFIRKDVIQYVESHYRTDPDNRSYFGYSAGGLFGAYTLLVHPDTFKNYILGSPSVQGDIPYLSELESTTSRTNGFNANVFISYGSLEEELSEHIKTFITMLTSRKDDSLSLQQVVIEGTHQTAFPSTGVSGVTWLSSLIKGEE